MKAEQEPQEEHKELGKESHDGNLRPPANSPVHKIEIEVAIVANNKGKGAAREEQGENLSTVKGKEKEERSGVYNKSGEGDSNHCETKINFTKI